MDAAKEYEWVQYIAQGTLISDKAARETEVYNRLLKLKIELSKLYGSEESKWRPLYLRIKERSAQKAQEYGERKMAKAHFAAAAAAPLLVSMQMGRPLTAAEATKASQTAALAAGHALLKKHKGGKSRRRRHRIKRSQKTRSNKKR